MSEPEKLTIVSFCDDNIVKFETEYVIPLNRLDDWYKWLNSEKWDFPDYAVEVVGRVVFTEYETICK